MAGPIHVHVRIVLGNTAGRGGGRSGCRSVRSEAGHSASTATAAASIRRGSGSGSIGSGLLLLCGMMVGELLLLMLVQLMRMRCARMRKQCQRSGRPSRAGRTDGTAAGQIVLSTGTAIARMMMVV